MIERYTRAEMADVWADTTRFGRWLEVELLATEAHAELGARVCRAWNLPERVETLIAEHHDPGHELDAPGAILELADHLAIAHGCPAFVDMPAPAPRSQVLDLLHVTPAMMTALQQQADAIAVEASGLA